MRKFVDLLKVYIPVIAGWKLMTIPLLRSAGSARTRYESTGGTPDTWIQRSMRYAEKLATPDVSIADLIGDIDPVKIAEGRYLSDELAIHYGLIPRANRGILSINELPDLHEKIQVGLFNLLEEQDVQIRGYRYRCRLISSSLPLQTPKITRAEAESLRP